jgi:phospholipid/cholesterol/gamma-HCH transport system substrate-binding protein
MFERQTVIGMVMVVTFAIIALGIYNKERVTTIASGLIFPHDQLTAVFSRDYQLRNYKSDVKVAGVVVGKVIDVSRGPGGQAVVTMQLDPGVRRNLGGAPSASIRPTTILGGKYYIDIKPGSLGAGLGSDQIPLSRTTVPIELDRVLATLTPPAQKGLQSAIGQTDATLRNGGQDALRTLLTDAPATLAPAADALTAAEGNRPSIDWAQMVGGLHNVADSFTQQPDQTRDIIESLDATTASLAAAEEPVSQAVGSMPQTLDITRAGLSDLQPTLDQIVVTGKSFRPSAQRLDALTRELDPILHRAYPFVADLRDVLNDARPVVNKLVPVTRRADEMFDNLSGPVLHRVNGPIARSVLSPWKGSGPYEGDGLSNHKLYQELGYLSSNLATSFGYHDKSGAFTRLDVGMGSNSIGGVGQPFQQGLEKLGLLPPSAKAPVLNGTSRPRNGSPPLTPRQEPSPLLLPLQGGAR